MTVGYPFSAVVGHDDLKLALLLNAVSPAIGGVLVRGEKGTAKSTVVRSLAALLPRVAVVAGCRFSCDPAAPDPSCPDGPHASGLSPQPRPARLVELPVGASEDRVAGSLDLERALTEGVKAYEPGLLAAAHRGVLYVDEVNLLHDHLVDLLLDAAAMGVAHVEREGVSVRHAARFLLVGTMNPEEGELRPQLLDRFGLAVEVRASRDPAERAEVVRRRLAFDAGPAGFARAYAGGERDLALRIAAARERLPAVALPDDALRKITAVCAAFDVEGMRADLVMARTAVALAAWEGRDEVTSDDVRTAARLALPHRRRRDPFDDPSGGPGGGPGDGKDHGIDEERLEQALADADDAPDDGPDDGPDKGPDDGPDDGGPSGGGGEQAPVNQAPVNPGAPYRTRLLAPEAAGRGGPAGRRGRTTGESGRTVGARTPDGRLRRLNLAATLAAAAPHQHRRGHERGRAGSRLVLRREDLRESLREGRESNLVLFCVDASGSMAARARMRAVKGAVLSLLLDAYQRRDKVGLVTFRGAEATVALPPTSSVDLASARLARLATGGRTPLAAGLRRAEQVLAAERLRDPRRRPLLVVVTDGRHTAGPDPVTAARRLSGVASVVVDCEHGPVRLGLAGRLAAALGGTAIRLEELAAGHLAAVVRDVRRVA
ncbi:putative cobaltochelatase [Microbispora hainanensis]|uniref:putative cobaltochelatase n=1 Tax=Microbispora hainanensis TaxID=568844 RepID=UPI0033F5714F